MSDIWFTHPWILLLALAVPLLLLVRRMLAFPRRSALLLSAYDWVPQSARRLRLPDAAGLWLRLGALLCLVPVAAGIRAGRPVAVQAQQGEALVIVLDISSSMTAEDFTPGNRLQTARELLSEFSGILSHADLGLILLAASPRLVVPVTAMREALPRALAKVSSAGFGEDGTAIGSGIASAVNRLRSGPWGRRRILLVTDGVNNRGGLAPADAARIAAAMGIRIDAIGIGTDSDSRYWVPVAQGEPVEVTARIQIDDKALEEMSRIAGGTYARARNSGQLRDALLAIAEEERTRAAGMPERPDFSWIRMLAGTAVLLICLELVWTRFMFAELPG